MEQSGILTPVGRLVQGNPFEAQTTNMENKPLVDKAGNPRSEFFFAIAILKTDPGFPALMQQIRDVATQGFPGGEHAQPTFSWKVIDGDDPKNAGKEGFAGHWVLRCSGGFQPKVYQRNAGGEIVEVVDPNQLKRGYYIRTHIVPKANGSKTMPGVYLNPSIVEIVGFGAEIVGGPDGKEILGSAPAPVLPQGASTTPIAGAAIAPPGAPVAAPMTPPVTPAPQAAVAPAPVAAVVPAPDFLNGPAVAPGQVAATPVMTALAKGNTYEQMLAAGWTHEMLVAQGMIAA